MIFATIFDYFLFGINTVDRPTNKRTGVPTLRYSMTESFKKAAKHSKLSKKEFQIGDFVLARMKGYSPWPAKVISFTKDRKSANCYFFGSDNNGSVKTDQIIPFQDGFDTIRLLKMFNLKDFEKGVREIEYINKIPAHLSALREIDALC